MTLTPDHPQELHLPSIEFGPFRYPIGYAKCVLRAAEIVNVISEGKIEITARRSESVLELSNGARVLLSAHKEVKIPDGLDGILRPLGNGQYQWFRHRMTEAFEENAGAKGLAEISRAIAAEWIGRFSFRAEKPNERGEVEPGSEGLRPPQLGALHAIGAHWSLSSQPGTVVMPTGTGKTETMLSTLAAFACSPLLVVVPSDALREQTARKFYTFGLLRQLGVLATGTPNPVVGFVTKRPKSSDDLSIFSDCNVVIATMAALGDGKHFDIATAIASRVKVLVVDEAHHIGAPGWARSREAFTQQGVLQFTATPFRRDGRLVDGAVIYNYPLRKAQEDNYFKPIDFEPIYEIDDRASDRAIAVAALAKLRADVANGLNHLLMARCEKIERAHAVFAIYEELAPELAPLLVHSEMKNASQELLKLRAGSSRIVVCVNMLGEGFDLPELKIAAVHDLHKSLAVLLQFAGRFTRTAGERIGRATVIANIADPRVSDALERLYSEDADWNLILSELSSKAAKEHSRLVGFLTASRRIIEQGTDDEVSISHQLLCPPLSTMTYECTEFAPKNFHLGLPKEFSVRAAWLNEERKTLFFVTRTEPTLRWTRSKSLLDRQWDLFVIHFDDARKLLYLSASDHSTPFGKLSESVGATRLVAGDVIFRALGRINRLLFQSIGVKKHGRRNLRYAMYTGADVAEALSVSERAGSVKSNLSGTGWEDGKRVSIGCSYKGRIWTVEQGSILALTDWCEKIGAKLRDENIDTSKIIENVLIPQEVESLPEKPILSVEWPVEILGQPENRVTFSRNGADFPLFLTDLRITGVDSDAKRVRFALVDTDESEIGLLTLTLDQTAGFRVESSSGVRIKVGKIEAPLEDYLSDYPPLIRFVDLTELDGNMLIAPKSAQQYSINDDHFEVWNWTGVDRQKESLWKNGAERFDSIQWHSAQNFISAGFSFVFDDDAAGEAADLVCMNEEDDHIKLVLVHCKFAGGTDAGERVKDVVEVCSQAIRSAKWKWKFQDLCRHLALRNERLGKGRPSRCLSGRITDLNRFLKASRLKEVRAEILIVQPGLSRANRTDDQSMVLAAAVSYLKETIGVDLRIVCDE